MTDREPHTCPYCRRVVMWRTDLQKPVPSEVDMMNGYDYVRCQHCGYYYHSASDCCPSCMSPYCEGGF